MKTANFGRFSLLFLAILSFSRCTPRTEDPLNDALVLDCNNLSSQNWTNRSGNDAVDYIVNCHLEIRQGTLNIESGTTIAFGPNGSLTIGRDAKIEANGTAAAPIRFTRTEGDWGGIGIYSTNATNVMRHCVIEHAGGQSPWTVCLNRSAAVYLEGKLSFENCSVLNSKSDGVHLYQCVTSMVDVQSFRNNTISNAAGYPIYSLAGQISKLDLPSCTFSGNRDNFVALVGESSNLLIPEGSHTWRPANIPYLVLTNLSVADNTNLTLEAGCDLAFEADTYLGMFSATSYIRANGTASNPVKIRGKQATEGWWVGLNCQSMNANNIFDYTNFSDGGLRSITYNGNLRSTVYAGPWFEGRLTLNHCTVSRSAGTCDVVIGNAATQLTVTGTNLSSCNDF